MSKNLVPSIGRFGPALVIVLLAMALWHCPGFFTPGTYINWGDLVAPMDPAKSLEEALSTWSPYNLWGQANVWLSFGPWHLMVCVLYWLKVPLWVLNRLYLVVPTAALGWGVLYLGHTVFRGRFSQISSLVAAMFAMLQPEFPGTSLFSLALGGDALILAGVIRGLENPGKGALKPALLVALGFLMSAPSPRFTIITGVAVGAYILIRLLFEPELRGWLTLKFLSVAATMMILLNFFWILPIVWFYTGNAIGDLFVTEGVFTQRIQWYEFNKPWAGVLWISRLITGNPDNIASGIMMQVPWAPLSLLCPLYVYACLLWKPRRRTLPFALVSLLLTVLAAASHYPVLDKLYVLMFTYVPGFNIIQSPNYWLFIMGILYAVLAGATVQNILQHFWNSHLHTRFRPYLGVLIVALIVSHITLVNGWPQLISVRPTYGPWKRHMAPFHTPTVKIPEPYQWVHTYILKNHREGDRLLNLPWWEMGPAVYGWWPYFTFPDIPGLLRSIPSLGLVTGYSEEPAKGPISYSLTGRRRLGITPQVLSSGVGGDPEMAYQLLKTSRFRYLLVHKDYQNASIVFPPVSPNPPRDYWALRAILADVRFFTLIRETPYFAFYELRPDSSLESAAKESAVLTNVPYRDFQDETSKLDSLPAMFKNAWDPRQIFVSANGQGKSQGTAPFERLESLLSATQSRLLLGKDVADFVLNLIDSPYRLAAGNGSGLAFNSASESQTRYVLSQRVPDQRPAEILLTVDDQLLAPADQTSPTGQLVQLSRVWQFHGEANLDRGRHEIKVFQLANLKSWRPRYIPDVSIKLFEANLPKDFPDYNTRGGNATTLLFLGDRQIASTYGDWSALSTSEKIGPDAELRKGDQTLYEIGYEKRRSVIVGFRSASMADRDSLANARLFFLSRNMNRHVSAVLVAPKAEVNSLLNRIVATNEEPYRNLIQTQERRDVERYQSTGYAPTDVRGKYEHGITQNRNDVLVPAPGDYQMRALIRPRLHSSPVFALSGERNWEVEATRWFNPLITRSEGSAERSAKPFVLDRENIYELETDHHHRWRWGSNNMRMLLVNPRRFSVKGDLSFYVSSVGDRDLRVSLNRDQTRNFRLRSRYLEAPFSFQRLVSSWVFGKSWARYQTPFPVGGDLIELKDVTLKPGANELLLYTPQKVERLTELLDNADDRAASIQIWEGLDFKEKERADTGIPPEATVVTALAGTADGMQVRMFFDKDSPEMEYEILERDLSDLASPGAATGRPTPGIDLDDYPYFKLRLFVTDPSVQAMDVVFGISHNGSEEVSEWIPATASRVKDRPNELEVTAKLSTMELAGIPEPDVVRNTPVADAFYRLAKPRLVRLFLVARKKPGKGTAALSKEAPFTFEIRELSIYNDLSLLVREDKVSLSRWESWTLQPVQRPDGSALRHRSLVTDENTWVVSGTYENRTDRVIATSRLGSTATFILKAELSRVQVDYPKVSETAAQLETTAESEVPTELQETLKEPKVHSRITQVTGTAVKEDEQTITVARVKELDGATVALRRDGISLRVDLEPESQTEFAPDALVASVDLRGANFAQASSLMVTYRLDDRAAQTLMPELVIDVDGDGKGDETLFPGKREALKEWKYADTVGPYQVFQTRLPQDFPNVYDTSNQAETSWGMDYFVVKKNGVPLATTWNGWPPDEEAVKVIGWRGFPLQPADQPPKEDVPRRLLQITVPSGTAPQEVYSVEYLPLPHSNIFGGRGNTLELNWPDLRAEFYPRSPQARPVTLRLRLARSRAFQPTRGPQEYSFEIEEVGLYSKVPFSGRFENWPRLLSHAIDRPLFTLGKELFQFQPESQDYANGLNSEFLWSKPTSLHAESAGYIPGGLNVKLDATFEVALVEMRKGITRPVINRSFAEVHRSSRLTRYTFDVRSEGPFWLLLWQEFHPGWKAYILDERRASRSHWFEFSALLSWFFERNHRTLLKEHFRANLHDNGWYIRRPGQYRIVAEYGPQVLLEVGVLVSLVTLCATLWRIGRDHFWRGIRG
ncbi:MAG: hypothetical protein HY315_00540 [Acidobacteria bacterium]|nr:hypothetical protein [Acidobacteriota bacterium]